MDGTGLELSSDDGSGLCPMVTSRLGGIQPSGSAISVSVCMCIGCSVYFAHDRVVTQGRYIEVAVPMRQLLHHICNADSMTTVRRRYQLQQTVSHHGTLTQHSDTWSVYYWVEAVQCPYIFTLLSKSQLVGRSRSVQFPLTDTTVGKCWYADY